MRSSIVASTVIHLVGLIMLFAVRTSAPLIVPGPDVVNVSLVQQPTLTAAPVTPPKPKVEEAPRIKPVEETGVKLSEPRPKPRAEPAEKEPEPQVATPALPSARVGSAGLSGSVAVDAVDFEFTYYLILIRNRIAQNWTPPGGIVTGGQPIRTVVYFRVARNGDILAVSLETAAGIEFFDQSAVRAVRISNPLPPLPVGFNGSDLGVHFGFEYAGP